MEPYTCRPMASFVVIYYGGTGSSWLVNVLGSIPGVLIPAYEPLEPWHWKAADADKLAWLELALSPPDSRDKDAVAGWTEGLAATPQFQRLTRRRFETVAFKMTVAAISDTEALFAILAARHTRLVVLERRNRVKHALSLYRSHEEGKNQFRFEGLAPPTVVDVGVLDRWVEHAAGWHRRTIDFRAEAGRRLGQGVVHTVAYEDFVTAAGKQATLARVCGYLGLDPEAIRSDGGYRKATADDLAETIVNYDEVRAHFAGTPLASCFD